MSLVVSVVCAASALALYVLGELAARMWIRVRGRYDVSLPGLRLHFRPDRQALPEYEPLVRIEINADGERGAEVPRTADDLYRVLATGGSPVEGFSTDQPSHWPAVVERILSAPQNLQVLSAARVHVGSVGRSGIASADLDVVLQRVLPRYRHLDAIVIMIGGNDVANWLACGAPAEAPAPPVPVSELFACHPEGRFGWHPARSALVELLTRWRRLWLRPVKLRDGAGRWIVEARAMRARATELRTTVSDPTAMLNNFEECFGRVLRRAQAHATQVLALRQPWFEKEYTPDEVARFWHGAAGFPWKKEAVSVYYALDVVNRLMTLLDARAAQVAERLGVEHLDLNATLEPGVDNYYDYVHYTPAGAKKVAHAVAAALLRQATQAGRSERSPSSARGRRRIAPPRAGRPGSRTGAPQTAHPTRA